MKLDKRTICLIQKDGTVHDIPVMCMCVHECVQSACACVCVTICHGFVSCCIPRRASGSKQHLFRLVVPLGCFSIGFPQAGPKAVTSARLC